VNRIINSGQAMGYKKYLRGYHKIEISGIIRISRLIRSKENLYLRKVNTWKDIMIIWSKGNPYIAY